MLIIIATVVSIVIGAIGLIATVGHGVKWIFRRGEVSVPRHACARGALSRPADPSPQATRRES